MDHHRADILTSNTPLDRDSTITLEGRLREQKTLLDHLMHDRDNNDASELGSVNAENRIGFAVSQSVEADLAIDSNY